MNTQSKQTIVSTRRLLETSKKSMAHFEQKQIYSDMSMFSFSIFSLQNFKNGSYEVKSFSEIFG